ncbi:diguanylate cyclase [Desulfosporosinus hippei]|uniref:Stage 0 sporulation protein A homolog n=1 Tax=Desulfosporosinus hippei DSM 8344 TaxID=1121419 RepID=A0A1G7WAK1_9FIRM|nr:diguanylate cyclase [Desulfosporosinus hippei]SDG68869.1 diguanylate cyclase (GGDEF) domain-containing protein [Desulfosporosinus hippei DSM 8344]
MSKKVLVVDDNKNNIRLFVDILEEEGYTVFTAENGLTVLELTYIVQPDVILLDIMMPEMDGFKVCEQLKRDNETQDIPVIMITAKRDSNDLHKAFELGAFDYIKKPINEIELLARLKSALKVKEYLDLLKAMATTDGLTGLYNHSLLLELLKKELLKQERNNQKIAFVMIDIDRFKTVNDTYGHTAGDIVLKELAKIIRKNVRASDIVGRYGGEEFSIILSDTELNDAVNLCERMRLEVQNHEFILFDKSVHITLSMGIFFKTPQNTIALGDIIKNADQALYTAKNNGRNRVEVYRADEIILNS